MKRRRRANLTSAPSFGSHSATIRFAAGRGAGAGSVARRQLRLCAAELCARKRRRRWCLMPTIGRCAVQGSLQARHLRHHEDGGGDHLRRHGRASHPNDDDSGSHTGPDCRLATVVNSHCVPGRRANKGGPVCSDGGIARTNVSRLCCHGFDSEIQGKSPVRERHAGCRLTDCLCDDPRISDDRMDVAAFSRAVDG